MSNSTTRRSKRTRILAWVTFATLVQSAVFFGFLQEPIPTEPVRAETVSEQDFKRAVMIEGQHGTDSWHCSGFLVGPHSLATAAHCIRPEGQYTLKVGAHASEAEIGYSYLALCTATPAGVPDGYTDPEDWAFDFALFEVVECSGRSRDIGNDVGYLTLGLFQDQTAVETLRGNFERELTSLNYPSDAPEGTLWRSVGEVHHTSVISSMTSQVLDVCVLFCPSWRATTTTAASHGSSGGLVMDAEGNAVAITVARRSDGLAILRKLDRETIKTYRDWLRQVDPTSTNVTRMR